MTTFPFPAPRGFRVHLRYGQVYDGVEFPGQFVLVLEDPQYGLLVSAPDVDALLRGYGGGRIEWADTTSDQEET